MDKCKLCGTSQHVDVVIVVVESGITTKEVVCFDCYNSGLDIMNRLGNGSFFRAIYLVMEYFSRLETRFKSTRIRGEKKNG